MILIGIDEAAEAVECGLDEFENEIKYDNGLSNDDLCYLAEQFNTYRSRLSKLIQCVQNVLDKGVFKL